LKLHLGDTTEHVCRPVYIFPSDWYIFSVTVMPRHNAVVHAVRVHKMKLHYKWGTL